MIEIAIILLCVFAFLLGHIAGRKSGYAKGYVDALIGREIKTTIIKGTEPGDKVI